MLFRKLLLCAACFALAVIVAGCAGDYETSPVTHGEEVISSDSTPVEPILCGLYSVARVVDGDTIIVTIDGNDVKVRMIGIDTPESVAPDEYYKENVPEGTVASDFTKELLSGKSVYLEYDVQTEDDYGRTLAYVYLDDGVTMVQRLLLSAGMAQTMTIQPNSKYADAFYLLQKEAREAGAGFWGE